MPQFTPRSARPTSSFLHCAFATPLFHSSPFPPLRPALHPHLPRPPPPFVVTVHSSPISIQPRLRQSSLQHYLTLQRRLSPHYVKPPHHNSTPTLSSSAHPSHPSTSPLRMPSGESPRGVRAPSALPSALEQLTHLAAALVRDRRRVVFFLDYDGTLSPIVEDPDSAIIPERTREALSIVASRFTTAIVSGRSKEKVMRMVNLEQLIYAGSHGFDIEGPQGVIAHRVASDWLPSLKAASKDLEEIVPLFPGSQIEDNLLSISFHYRMVDPVLIPEAQRMVDEVVQRHGLLRTMGKMVYEVRPLFDWHKGKAVEYLLEALNLLGPEVLPIYIGDDVTDEDAFKVLQGKGISVVVADPSTSRNTHADMRLNDPLEVQRFLMHFARDETLAPCLTESVRRPNDVSVASE